MNRLGIHEASLACLEASDQPVSLHGRLKPKKGGIVISSGGPGKVDYASLT